ncbi:MAG TPA: MTAP family purine nucleoside phosphorylase [Solirubrobacterales bacterium]
MIIGSNALGPGGAEIIPVAEAQGPLVLQRHGPGTYRPPHLIDHAANMRAVVDAGCDRVLAISSVGSLHPELAVGSFVCPNDFISLQTSVSVFDDARGHKTPGFDLGWRDALLSAWAAKAPTALRDGGVYWQTDGPRFETPAEIRLIAAHADLVGMTLASECIVAGELGLRYAAVCVVDNLANGVGPKPLSIEALERDRCANAARLRDALATVLTTLVA